MNIVVFVVLLVRNIYKLFGDYYVLKGILFDVYEGDVILIFGVSGLGKSMFLCCLNLFEIFDDGFVVLVGEELVMKCVCDGKLYLCDWC